MSQYHLSFLVAGLFLLLTQPGCSFEEEEAHWVIQAPADTAYTRVRPQGVSVLPNGRLLRPRGKTLRIAPHPYGLVLSPDGSLAITANSGTRPFSISLIAFVAS